MQSISEMMKMIEPKFLQRDIEAFQRRFSNYLFIQNSEQDTALWKLIGLMAVSLHFFQGPNGIKFKVSAPRNMDAELVWRATIAPKFMSGLKMQAFCSQFQISSADGRKRSCWRVLKQKLPTDCEILEQIHPLASRAAQTRAWKSGEQHAMDKQRLVEDATSPHSIYTHRSDHAFNQTKRARDKANKEHFRKGKRPKTPNARRARENACQLIRKQLGTNTAALPASIIKAPTRKRHKIAEGWFHPSEKLHISQIRAVPGGPATIPEAKRRIVTVITNKLQLAGLQHWQFQVECRAANQGWFNAKIGLPGPTYVDSLVPYLRKLFPTWIIKAGVNKWYEQTVWNPLIDSIGDALRDASPEAILRSLILTKAPVWPVHLCVFIDGWKKSLFFKMKLIVSHPCFEYARELHTTSQIVPWQGVATAGEHNLKQYSKFSLEVEDVLGRIIPVETERGSIDCLVTPGSWSLDNKALWYALGLCPGSFKDAFRRGSVPYMWGRSLFLGPAIFTTREHLNQAQVFFQLLQAHISVEIKSQGGDPGNLQHASPAMMKRARAYAKLLVGQNYDRSPLIANSQQGPESPLQAMLVVPALLHALIHQVESTVGLASILFKDSKGFLLT
jgi:hypothetical protein